MADFVFSEGATTNPPSLPLEGSDLLLISQLRGGVWTSAVISLNQVIAFVAAGIQIGAGQINSGVLPIARGGTGASDKAAARGSLEVASLGANAFTGDQTVTGRVAATGGFDDTL